MPESHIASTEPPLLFISYASENAVQVAELRGILQADGYRTWIAPDDIRGSEPWAEQILEAITTANMVIVLLSSDSLRSAHVGREVMLAVDQGLPVLPVRIEDVALFGTLQYLLALVQWFDAFPPPLHLHAERLSKRVVELLDGRTTPSEPLARRSGQSLRHNLPGGPMPLLGRERDLEAVAESLTTHRVVTVVGTGGVGKTRCALQAADDLVDRYPGGVWLVELAAVSPEGDLGAVLVESLGLATFDTRSDLDRVMDFVGQQEVLLLLDNCEHLLEPVALAVQHLLRRCSRLRVLATSRARLHLTEELVYELRPLELPALRAEASVLASTPAIRLLTTRAKDAGAGDPMLTDPEATASVCRRVDGLPLALELAASRLRVMSISDLDASLAGGLRLLSSRHSSGPSHHATMTATIEWSRRLLDDLAQELFPALGIFQGGFDLGAAAFVCDIDSGEVVELISDLVEASLVTYVPAARVSRYRMLEPVRQHALYLLAQDPGREARTHDSYTQHFRRLAVEAETHMMAHGQGEWLSRLNYDYDNLQAVLSRLEDTDPDGFLDLAAALANYWFHRGLFREGKSVLATALSTGAGPDERRIDALTGLAQLCWVSGEHERGEEAAAMALDMAEDRGDQHRSVIVKDYLGRLLMDSGRGEEAATLLKRVRTDARRLRMGRSAADAIHFLGILAQRAGDYQRARDLHREARTEFEAAGDENGVSWALGAEAVDAWRSGQLGVARTLMAESNAMHSRLGETRGLAGGKMFEALFAMETGDLSGSQTLAEEAVRQLRDLGLPRDLSAALVVLARVVTETGDYERGALLMGAAESIFDRAVELPVLGDGRVITILKEKLAGEFEFMVDLGRGLGWDGLNKLLRPT